MRAYAHQVGTPASDAEIAAVEKQFGVSFCDDYKDFLRTDNGLYIEELPDNEDEEWLYDVNEFYGIGDSKDGNFQGAVTDFFDPRFLPIYYPVGSDFGGNPLVQIAAGPLRGQLAMLDHELYNCGMAALLDVSDGYFPDEKGNEHCRVRFNSFAEATPEEVLEECFEPGYLNHFPVTLEQHLKNLDAFCSRAE